MRETQTLRFHLIICATSVILRNVRVQEGPGGGGILFSVERNIGSRKPVRRKPHGPTARTDRGTSYHLTTMTSYNL